MIMTNDVVSDERNLEGREIGGQIWLRYLGLDSGWNWERLEQGCTEGVANTGFPEVKVTGRKRRETAVRRHWSPIIKDLESPSGGSTSHSAEIPAALKVPIYTASNQEPKCAPAPVSPQYYFMGVTTTKITVRATFMESGNEEYKSTYIFASKKSMLCPNKRLTRRQCEEGRQGSKEAAHSPISGNGPRAVVYIALYLDF